MERRHGGVGGPGKAELPCSAEDKVDGGRGLGGGGRGGKGLAGWREEAGAAVDALALAKGLADREAAELSAELRAPPNPEGSDKSEEAGAVASAYQ